MPELINFMVALFVLALGIPIGDYLARKTKEELKQGQIWFKIIIIFSLIAALFMLILGNDAIMFALLFIAVVTSRSLKKK